MTLIDLRSDTVTQPTEEMRAAMAAAIVGDDVYGEDPTINQLERRAAEIFEHEAALFVPTGTMGNQIGLRVNTEHGNEIICEARAHIHDWEMGMAAAFSGCTLRAVPAERGILTWAEIKPAIGPKLYYRAQTRLISIENSHNMAGGTVTPLAVLEEIWAGAKDAGLKLHLDGARIFNAAAALDVPVARLVRGFDTINVCLSKGLCAPVGSLVVGSRATIERARIFRKALGGGMRQAGVLAAAGLIALEEMPKRLGEDHANARYLAEAIATLPEAEINVGEVETNIVIFRLRSKESAPVVAALKQRGILTSAIGPQAIRLVTHRDVSRAACVEAAESLAEILSA